MAMDDVSLADMRRLVRDPRVVVLDVRSPEAYTAGHLPGALSIPVQELRERTPAELPDRPTTADLVWMWLATIALWAFLYWGLTIAGIGGLQQGGDMIGGGRSGFWTALYF